MIRIVVKPGQNTAFQPITIQSFISGPMCIVLFYWDVDETCHSGKVSIVTVVQHSAKGKKVIFLLVYLDLSLGKM